MEVNLRRILRDRRITRSAAALFAFLLSATSLAAAETTVPSQPAQTKFSEARAAFGKTNGVSYELAPIDSPLESSTAQSTDTVGFYATLNAMLFGKDRSVLETQAGMTDLLEGESDFYWGGFRVWSSKPEYKDGSFQMSAGLPTVSMRAPLIAVPVGPVTIQLDAGISAEASVTAKVTPMISIPIQFTSVKAELKPEAYAVGFLEGYAKWIAIRAGVGGELELISANADISGQVSFGAYPPSFSLEGYIGMLAGQVYGFVDYFNIFKWKWKRALQPVFADWPGKCYGFPSKNGGGDPCVDFKP